MTGLSNSRWAPPIRSPRVAHEPSQLPNSEQASQTLPNTESVPGEQILPTESYSPSGSKGEDPIASGSGASNEKASKEPVPSTYGEWVQERTLDFLESERLGIHGPVDIHGALDMKVAEYMKYLQRFHPVYLTAFSSYIDDVHAAEIADFSSQTLYPSSIISSFEEWRVDARFWYTRHYPQMDEYELLRRMQYGFTAKLRTASHRRFVAEIAYREKDMRVDLESQTWESLGLSDGT